MGEPGSGKSCIFDFLTTKKLTLPDHDMMWKRYDNRNFIYHNKFLIIDYSSYKLLDMNRIMSNIDEKDYILIACKNLEDRIKYAYISKIKVEKTLYVFFQQDFKITISETF